jgi:hypothetical protein
MKNQVIKVLNVEHGEKVKEYFKYLGYDIGHLNDPNVKLNVNSHYGVINEFFNAYTFVEILQNNAEIIKLPINSKNPKLNKKKVGRPKLTQEQKIRIAKSKERVKKRLQQKEIFEGAAKTKRKTLSEFLRDDILNKNRPSNFDEPISTETPKVVKELTLDLSIYSNGKLSLYFECENYSLINNLMADASKLFSQQNSTN